MDVQTSQAATEPSQDSSVVDMYLSAPASLKSAARKAIGARNDDDAIKIMNTDGNAASTVKAILAKTEQQSVLSQGDTSSAPEDIMYPRAK